MVARCASDLRDLLNETTLVERKAFIRSFVKEVRVTGEEALLTYTIPLTPQGMTEEKLAVLSTGRSGGRWRIRTTDPMRVKHVL